MNRIHRIHRRVAVLAGLAFTWLGLTVGAPAAFAATGSIPVPTGGGDDSDPLPVTGTVTRIVVVGGTPGWQIALIAVGAALAAAAAAVLAYRIVAARHLAVSTTAAA
jgi:hypothetical protein